MESDRSTPYAIGELHQACSRCDWQQSRHHLELTNCPRCRAPVDYHRAAIEFGGLSVGFDGTRFAFRDRMGRCFEVDEADYPDTIQFMQRHARFSYPPRKGDPT